MDCQGCRDSVGFSLPFSMAFQPIVDVVSRTTFAHEALVRGTKGEGANTILSAVDVSNRYTFDQQCRVKAIEMAAKLGLSDAGACLSINFMPNAVYEPRACIRLTLDAAKRTGFPLNRIIFEFTEGQKLDTSHLLKILGPTRRSASRQPLTISEPGMPGFSSFRSFSRTSLKSTWIWSAGSTPIPSSVPFCATFCASWRNLRLRLSVKAWRQVKSWRPWRIKGCG